MIHGFHIFIKAAANTAIIHLDDKCRGETVAEIVVYHLNHKIF